MSSLFCRITILILLSSCAAHNQYLQPGADKASSSAAGGEKSIPGIVVVEHAPALVWQKIIGGVGKAGFTVESVNETALTVQLRYAGSPQGYIDCGRVISKVKTTKGERNYDFPAAQAYQQYQLQQGSKLFLVDRRMALEAHATVTLQALTQSRTRVKVEGQYVVTRDQSVQGGGSKPFGVTDKVSFVLSEGATFPNAATKCRATGKFESDVLALARR